MHARQKSSEHLIDKIKTATDKNDLLMQLDHYDYSQEARSNGENFLHVLADAGTARNSFLSENDRIEIFNYMAKQDQDRFIIDFTAVDDITKQTPIQWAFRREYYLLVMKWIDHNPLNAELLLNDSERFLEFVIDAWSACGEILNGTDLGLFYIRVKLHNLRALFKQLSRIHNFNFNKESEKTKFELAIDTMVNSISRNLSYVSAYFKAFFLAEMVVIPPVSALNYALSSYYEVNQTLFQNQSQLAKTMQLHLLEIRVYLMDIITILLEKGAAIGANLSHPLPKLTYCTCYFFIGTRINGKPAAIVSASDDFYQYHLTQKNAITSTQKLKGLLQNPEFDREKWIDNCTDLLANETTEETREVILSVLNILNYYHPGPSNNLQNSLVMKCIVFFNSNPDVDREHLKYSKDSPLPDELRALLHIDIDNEDIEETATQRCMIS